MRKKNENENEDKNLLENINNKYYHYGRFK